MSLRFSMLASGSSGNAAFVEAQDFGFLLDIGLGPRQLQERLQAVNSDWGRVRAVVLTHTHADHWNERTLARLVKQGIPLYAHWHHHINLRQSSPAFAELRKAGLARVYELGQPFSLFAGCTVMPLPVKHDDTTCGFRIEIGGDLFGPAVAMGYVADLGSWTPALADVLANVDLLAVEFNHDVVLQETSGRPQMLISRVLGDRGHLSNAQAAELLRAVLERSEPGRLKHVVQLHLSRECNRPTLAVAAARAALASARASAAVHTATQDEAGPSLALIQSEAEV